MIVICLNVIWLVFWLFTGKLARKQNKLFFFPLCIGHWPTQAFFFKTKRNLNYVSVWPTHKSSHIRPFCVHPYSACCVHFAWAWPTQDASTFASMLFSSVVKRMIIRCISVRCLTFTSVFGPRKMPVFL